MNNTAFWKIKRFWSGRLMFSPTLAALFVIQHYYHYNTITKSPLQHHHDRPPSQQYHYNTIITTPSLQHHHYNTIITTPSVQHHHYNTIITIPSLQHHHYINTSTSPPLQPQHHNTNNTGSTLPSCKKRVGVNLFLRFAERL